MYPLQGPPGEDEHNAPEPHQPSQEAFLRWFIRAATVAYLTGTLVTLWRNDEVRLEFLHAFIRVLQNTARLFGTWALLAEKNYNTYVDTLH